MAISKQAFIEASKAKPTFTAEQGAVTFARQGLGSVIEWTELEANYTNCVYKAVCCAGSGKCWEPFTPKRRNGWMIWKVD